MSSILRQYSTLSRWEFLPATGVAILIGVFLGLSTWGYLFDIWHILIILEGLFIFFLLFNVGFMVNCWADWEVDMEYKTHLSDAVKDVGRRTVGNLVAIHIVISVLLAVHVTWLTQKPVILILVLVGTFFGVAYSVEPFRFKSKGALHSVMAFPVFACPGLFSYYLVNDLPFFDHYTYIFLLLVLSITMAHYALVLLSQSEDYPDDKAMGITTPAVAWGLKTTIRRALTLNILGSFGSVISFFLFFYYADPAAPWLLILLPVLALMIFWTTGQVYKLNRAIESTKTKKATLKVIRKMMKDYPKFHAVPLGGIMLSALILMLFRSIEAAGWI